MVLAEGRIEVYVNGAATPSLALDDLGTSKNGGVALFVGNNSDGAFANLRITPTSQPGQAPQSTQTIFQAAGSGNLPRVQALVEGDAKAALARNESGLTLLHYAARFNQVRVAEYLLEHGADPNAVARHAGTPLDLAAEAGSADAAKVLEAKGGRLTPFRFEVTQLSPSIRRLAIPWGMMNNILVFAGLDGAVIVDTGFSARGVDDLRKAIEGLVKGGVRYLISSHGHGDHVAGNMIAPSPDTIITAQVLAARADRFSMTRATVKWIGRISCRLSGSSLQLAALIPFSSFRYDAICQLRGIFLGQSHVSRESADGQFVYYQHSGDSQKRGIWRVPVSGGAETLVLDKEIPPQDWDLTDRGIYFIDGSAKPVATICFFDFAARLVRSLAPVDTDPGFEADEGFSLSPDGKWLVYCGGFSTSDIMMIDNFR